MFFYKNQKILEFAKLGEMYPDIYTIRGPSTDPEVEVSTPNGTHKALMFSSNNYLGIANDPRVKKAVIRGIEKYGVGSGGSRLVSGNIEIQEELEKAIAEFKGCETAITFSTGYMANSGAIPAFLDSIDFSLSEVLRKKLFSKETPVVFSDRLNHASIIDGCRVARAIRAVYAHKDMNDLERQLKHYKSHKRKLIVTDGIFSMDGDIAPLDDMMDLAERYGAAVMVDDAHASGTIGENGRGTVEYFKLKEKPEILMGTFTKAFGAVGGFIAGSKKLVEYLRVTTRTYIYSAPIPPAIAVGILEAVKIIQKERRFEKLWENASYMHSHLRAMACNTLDSESQIVPIMIGEEKKTITVSRLLFEKHIFAPAIRWPAVPKGEGRLRITLMSTHTKNQIDTFLTKLREVKHECKF